VSRIEKLYEKMKRKPTPTDITFDEIHRLLKAYGFIQKKPSSGSHYVYVHPELEGYWTIAKNNPMKKGYIRETIRAIDMVKELYGGI